MIKERDDVKEKFNELHEKLIQKEVELNDRIVESEVIMVEFKSQ